jgi:hypothetical protein
VALLSALLCAWAAWSRNFWLLVAATVVAGYYSANGQLYRFAAAELAAPAFREKAVSLVLAGGLMGAVVGPNLASRTRTCCPGALCRRLPGAGRGGAAVDGGDGGWSVSAGAAKVAAGPAQRPAAGRDHAPAGVHRGGWARRWATA